jgi:hypothetical protein
MPNERDLKLRSVQYRKALLRLIKNCGAGHTGGDLSSLSDDEFKRAMAELEATEAAIA